MDRAYEYEGQELDIFARATNWKRYFRREIRPFLRGRVLEVGAGIGTTTKMLYDKTVTRWTCLEPDPILAQRLEGRVLELPDSERIRIRVGTVSTLDRREMFDAIIYIDVLEHVEDDTAELQTAAEHLAPNGSVVVLSPAHQWLYTPFDEAIGHYRRYNRKSLTQASPPQLRLQRMRYLDSVGMVASMGNRLLLQQKMPGVSQVLLWDRLMVPCSRIVDKLLGYRYGKSILGIWTKRVATA